MRVLSRKELDEILKKHSHWIYKDVVGCENMRADLRGAYLRGTDLKGAYLSGAYLSGADLSGVTGFFIPYSCPDFGSFIGYKKACGYIVELEIPADAKRLSGTGRKCRCDKAKVLGIYDNKHNLLNSIVSVPSDYDSDFVYKAGEIVKVDDFDEDRWNECSKGIHFFINFQEAVNY